MITAQPFFTLFLGSPNGSARLDEHARVSALHKISSRFESFTLVDGKGCFRNRFEDVLLVHLASSDVRAVVELALDLRRAFFQDGVGIACAGQYIRATESQEASAIEAELRQLLGEQMSPFPSPPDEA